MGRIPAGLCDSCRFQRLVPNRRGSVFSLCERSQTDGRFPKYPRVPVERCPGHELRAGANGDGGEEAAGTDAGPGIR